MTNYNADCIPKITESFLLKLGHSVERNRTVKIKVGHIANLDGMGTLNSNSVSVLCQQRHPFYLSLGKLVLPWLKNL